MIYLTGHEVNLLFYSNISSSTDCQIQLFSRKLKQVKLKDWFLPCLYFVVHYFMAWGIYESVFTGQV